MVYGSAVLFGASLRCCLGSRVIEFLTGDAGGVGLVPQIAAVRQSRTSRSCSWNRACVNSPVGQPPAVRKRPAQTARTCLPIPAACPARSNCSTSPTPPTPPWH